MMSCAGGGRACGQKKAKTGDLVRGVGGSRGGSEKRCSPVRRWAAHGAGGTRINIWGAGPQPATPRRRRKCFSVVWMLAEATNSRKVVVSGGAVVRS